jgi:hypothetical protein
MVPETSGKEADDMAISGIGSSSGLSSSQATYDLKHPGAQTDTTVDVKA